MELVEPQVLQWTRQEYYKMAEIGLFFEKQVELIEGQVIEMSPMGSLHRTAVILTGDSLRKIFTDKYFISTQCPLGLSKLSEPEPDVAVIAGDVRDYKEAHPTTAVLLVEVSDTSLEYDRTRKGSLYAKSRIADYWILNLLDYQLEVYREPMSDPRQIYGFSYASVKIFKAGDWVSPLAMEQARVAVSDLLP